MKVAGAIFAAACKVPVTPADLHRETRLQPKNFRLNETATSADDLSPHNTSIKNY